MLAENVVTVCPWIARSDRLPPSAEIRYGYSQYLPFGTVSVACALVSRLTADCSMGKDSASGTGKGMSVVSCAVEPVKCTLESLPATNDSPDAAPKASPAKFTAV